MSLFKAEEIIKRADMTKEEISWIETEVRDEAERQFNAGNLDRASTLWTRGHYLSAWRSEARIGTVGDQARLERDYKAFIRGLPAVRAKAERKARA